MKTLIITLGMLIIVQASAQVHAPTAESNTHPIACRIDLQEGFIGSFVRVWVNDEKVFEGKPITNPILGLAQGFSVQLNVTTSIVIRIEMHDNKIDFTRRINFSDGEALGVSFRDGKIEIIQQNHGFGYD